MFPYVFVVFFLTKWTHSRGSFLALFQKKPICIVRHLQVHLICNSYVTAHISNKNHIQAHTTSHRPKVFLSITSIPERAFNAPRCWCHITFVRKLNPKTKISNSLEYSCEWPKKTHFPHYKVWIFPFTRNRCRSGEKKLIHSPHCDPFNTALFHSIKGMIKW